MEFFTIRTYLKSSVILFFFLLTISSFAQVGTIISSVTTTPAKEKEPIKVEVKVLQSSNISSLILYYRGFGENEYKYFELPLFANKASAVIPASVVVAPYIEYYVEAKLKDGNSEYYPFEFSFNATPVQLPVMNRTAKDDEIIFMSPEANQSYAPSELFLSISLLRASDDVDKAATKVYLDNTDVTSMLLIADDLILFFPNNFNMNIPSGLRTINVELYDKNGNMYHTSSISFNISRGDVSQISNTPITYNFNLRGESRNENVAKVSTMYNNIGFDGKMDYSDWTLSTKLYVTSEDVDTLQPLNRYNITLSSDYLKLGYGDSYPSFPSLFMSGKRLRGLTGGLYLGFFNLEVSSGEVIRKVEGVAEAIYDDTANVFGSNIVSLVDGRKAILSRQGTFKRNVFAIRPSFGKGENFQWGFNYIHGIDEKSSITFGTRPKENVVIGTDMTIAIDDRRILLEAQTGFSLSNKDITHGTLSDDLLDSVFTTFDIETSQIKTIKNILGKFITVNQYLTPLNPQKFSSVGTEAALTLNYFNNYFKVNYLYRGSQFESFGLNYLKTDIKGINVTDRLRLMDNRLFLSVGFESLKDNLQKTKYATVTYNTLNASVSYFPRTDMPNVILAFTQNKNQSDIKVASADSIYAVDDITNRITAQLSYDAQIGVKNQFSLSLSTANRDDKSIYKGDLSMFSITLADNILLSRVTTLFTNISINTSEYSTTKYNYTSLLLGARHLMMDDMLLLYGAVNPSFGDYKRTLVDVSAQYQILQNLSAGLFLKYINSKTAIGTYNDSILGLVTQYGF